jgi:hypothetical protein
MAAGMSDWGAGTSSVGDGGRLSFQVGMRWILLLSVSGWVLIAGFIF